MKLVNYELIDNIEWHEFNCWENGIGGGVYRMLNDQGEIIYIGKSVNLYARLNAHLDGKTNTDFFINEVALIEWKYENDELNQLVLESILIKYYKPIYNKEVKSEKREYRKKVI